MELFISKHILQDDYPISEIRIEKEKIIFFIVSRDSKGVKLEIPNMWGGIIRNGYQFRDTDWRVEVSNVVFKEDSIIFEKGTNPNDDSIYALVSPILNTWKGKPGKIYVPAEWGNMITILKQFSLCGHTPISNQIYSEKAYFIKISSLPKDGKLPIYLSFEGEKELNTHFILRRSWLDEVSVVHGNTLVNLDDNYMELSECKTV